MIGKRCLALLPHRLLDGPSPVYPLCQLSAWSVGFYSELHIQGSPNVLKDGPLILASTHHNDIAVLAISIPHLRPISFWTKPSLFHNPLAGAILSSSGVIPVTRSSSSQHPTTTPTPGGPGKLTTPAPSLFETTSGYESCDRL